jgi:hypothetical protein
MPLWDSTRIVKTLQVCHEDKARFPDMNHAVRLDGKRWCASRRPRALAGTARRWPEVCAISASPIGWTKS